MRKTKIICTLGPASDTEEMIAKLFKAGMNVGRFNFSHGTHASHLEMIQKFRSVRDRLELPGAVLLDTKGPENRLRTFKTGHAELKTGQKFTLTSRDVAGDESICSVTYKDMPKYAARGNKILLDDGAVTLTVKETSGEDIICRVTDGGPVSDHKGVNLKGVALPMVFLSETDKSDILFAIENEVDYIAASFTRTEEDMTDLKNFLHENGGDNIKVIAKIENSTGVKNFKKILDYCDGIMVARGDMGVEIDYEKLPGIQKEIIRVCRLKGKIAITATQMLESMVNNPHPTRAEITDVANAVFDGTSAVMLSGESAAGKYPEEAVKAMSKIAQQAEKDAFSMDAYGPMRFDMKNDNATNAIAHAAFTTAEDLRAKCIMAITKGGTTARSISKFRPDVPIAACTPLLSTYHQLALNWGVYPIKTRMVSTFGELFETSIQALREAGVASEGDTIVGTGGSPVQVEGQTNLIKVETL